MPRHSPVDSAEAAERSDHEASEDGARRLQEWGSAKRKLGYQEAVEICRKASALLCAIAGYTYPQDGYKAPPPRQLIVDLREKLDELEERLGFRPPWR